MFVNVLDAEGQFEQNLPNAKVIEPAFEAGLGKEIFHVAVFAKLGLDVQVAFCLPMVEEGDDVIVAAELMKDLHFA